MIARWSKSNLGKQKLEASDKLETVFVSITEISFETKYFTNTGIWTHELQIWVFLPGYARICISVINLFPLMVDSKYSSTQQRSQKVLL